MGGTSTPSNGASITRNPGAAWFLPTLDEWYKAAYHQPAAQGGDVDDYWLYAMRTNDPPYSDQPPGSDAPTQSNTANLFRDDAITNGYNDGFAVTGSPDYDGGSVIYLTEVGAYAQAAGFYGTFDQAGNVLEWNEQIIGSRAACEGRLDDFESRLTLRARLVGSGCAVPSRYSRLSRCPAPRSPVTSISTESSVFLTSISFRLIGANQAPLATRMAT